MEKQRDHRSEGKRENPPLAAGRWRAISTVLIIGLIIVLSDLSYLQGGMAEDLPDRSGNDVWVSENGQIEFAANEELGQDKDSAPDEQDIERAYRELLTKKKKKVEDTTILRAGEDGFYRIYLVNGRTLQAVTVELDKKSVTITDSKGMTINLSRAEIVGIEKIEGKADGLQEE